MESKKKSTQHNNTATYLRLICTGVMLLLLLLLIWFDATTARRVSTTLWTKWIWTKRKKSIYYTGRSVGRSIVCSLARAIMICGVDRTFICLLCVFFFLFFCSFRSFWVHTPFDSTVERAQHRQPISVNWVCAWIRMDLCVCELVSGQQVLYGWVVH